MKTLILIILFFVLANYIALQQIDKVDCPAANYEKVYEIYKTTNDRNLRQMIVNRIKSDNMLIREEYQEIVDYNDASTKQRILLAIYNENP